MKTFHGQLELRATRRAGRTMLTTQSFRAPFHLSKPYWDQTTETLLVQVVNPTAGILAGDRLQADVAVGGGAALLVTTPSASRLFAMEQGEALSRQSFTVEAGGWLEVWPEPVIPHRRSSFQQHTRIRVERGGALFYADTLCAGRAAHGEAWSWQSLHTELELRLDGDLALLERFAHAGEDLQRLAAWAGAGDSVGFGNAVLVLPGGAGADGSVPWRDALQALQRDGVWIGVSALRVPEAWSIKFVAPDGIHLRRVLRDIRSALAPYARHLACDARKL